MNLTGQLFGEEMYDIVDYCNIETLSFETLAHSCNVMSLENIGMIDSFYSLHKTHYKPHSLLNPIFNSGANVKEYKFLLVRDTTGMLWFWAYKTIQIIKTKQIRFFDIPYSEKDGVDNDSMYAIIQKMTNLPFTRFVFQECFSDVFAIHTSKVPKRLNDLDDYFFRLDYLNVKFTNRYLCKRYINQCFSNDQITTIYSNKVRLKDICSLLDEWRSGMKERGHAVVSKSEKEFVRFISRSVKDAIYITLYYQKVPISLQVFTKDKELNIVECIYVMHVWESNGDKFLSNVIRNMTHIQKWLAWKYLGKAHKTIWYGNAYTERLRLHKDMMCDGKIEYYII